VTFTNKNFAAGAGLLIIGFLMFQYGLAAALNLDIYPVESSAFPPITTAGILTIETLGGIIAIIGLLLCFASITYDRRRGSKNTQQYLSQLNSNISALDRKIENTAAQLNLLTLSLREEKTQTGTSQSPVTAGATKETGSKCRFCGAKIGERAIFCPACGKSQV